MVNKKTRKKVHFSWRNGKRKWNYFGTFLQSKDLGTELERKALQNSESGKGKQSFTLVGQGTVKKRFTKIFGTWTLLSKLLSRLISKPLSKPLSKLQTRKICYPMLTNKNQKIVFATRKSTKITQENVFTT